MKADELGTSGDESSPTVGGPGRFARLRQILLVAGLALAAFVTGLAFFNYMLMPGLIHSESEVRTPDVRDLTLDQAEVTLSPLGLTLSRAGERFDSNVPSDFIISQDPRPGTPVRGSKQIRVVVSLGEEYSSIPALEGESLRSAEQLLMSAGLRLGHVSRAPSDEVGEGLVMASDPSAESILSRDAKVSLFVSSGSYPEAFVMPDLVGREIGRARNRMERAGFSVRVPPGTGIIGGIVYQHPAAGARLAPRDTIVLRAAGRLIQ
jgi:serine/threonine-protein kinase